MLVQMTLRNTSFPCLVNRHYTTLHFLKYNLCGELAFDFIGLASHQGGERELGNSFVILSTMWYVLWAGQLPHKQEFEGPSVQN